MLTNKDNKSYEENTLKIVKEVYVYIFLLLDKKNYLHFFSIEWITLKRYISIPQVNLELTYISSVRIMDLNT